MHDIVVVSDLHLGRGKNPDTGRYYPLEAFFFDDDFERFCAWLCAEAAARKNALKLVLNGDTFDFLRIATDPATPGASRVERRYGPLMVPARAAETVRSILAGHTGFVTGLAQVLLAGHQIVMLPGNHDPEVQWEAVQDVVRSVIRERMVKLSRNPATAASAATRLHFEPWFYYEPGRVWIEHGSQYDPDNACQYPLRTRLGSDAEAVAKTEPDLPMGSFFQRYLYNAFGNITFIVPNSRSNSRYVRWLLFNQPRLLARVAVSHLPFFIQVMRRIGKKTGVASVKELRGMHEAELAELAERSGLGQRLRAVDQLKHVRGSAAAVTFGILKEMAKGAVIALAIVTLASALWFAGFHAITQMQGGFGIKTVLFLGLDFLFLVLALIGLSYLLLRGPSAPATRPLRRTATDLAQLVDVPILTFGHSHEEVVLRLSATSEPPRWYFNTGTWIAVFTADELVPRERVQYTFLRITSRAGSPNDHRGDQGGGHEDGQEGDSQSRHQAELLHWSPGRREAVPVVLIEDSVHGDAHPMTAPAAALNPNTL